MRKQPHVRLYASALAKFLQFDLSRPDLESLGFMIGDLDGDTLTITDVVIGEQYATGGFVRLDEQALLEGASLVAETGKPIVGWIHSHPKMGAHFFSGTDVKTQELFQAQFPHAVAIVTDPNAFKFQNNPDLLDIHAYQVENEQPVEIPFELVLDPAFLLTEQSTGSEPTEVLHKIPKEDLEAISKSIEELDKFAIVDEEDRDILLGFGRLMVIIQNANLSVPESVEEAIGRLETRLEETLSRAEAAAYAEYDTELNKAYIILFSFWGLLLTVFWFLGQLG